MKIEVPFEIGDEVFVIRESKMTGCVYYYVCKETVKEVGADKKSQYVTIGGTRSNISQVGKKIFLNKKEATKVLESMMLEKVVRGYEVYDKIGYRPHFGNAVGDVWRVDKKEKIN